MTNITPWPQERTERVKALWQEGYSASQIGRELGVSRSAVIGKLHRVGGYKRMTHYVYRPKKAVARKATTPAPKPDTTSRLIPIVELDMERDCRFIPGESRGADVLYCAAEREYPGSAAPHCYCPKHARLCFNLQPARVR